MKHFIDILFIACCFLFSCQEPEAVIVENPAPALVSTFPENGAVDFTEATLQVVFTFDQNIKCTLEAQKGITVDNAATIDKINAYGTDLSVSLSGLERGNTYTVKLPEGTVLGYKENQKAAAAVSLSFSMKEPEKPATPMQPGVDSEGWENAASCVRNMGVGWNLGNTLDSNSGAVDNMWIEAFSKRTTKDYETALGQTETTRELIHMFKVAGFGAIRVPVTWYPHIGTVNVTVENNKGHWDMSTWTGYDVDPVWMARVKEIVDYVIDEGMYCILNVHHDTGATTTAWLRADTRVFNSVSERYTELWKQIATEFSSYGQKLVFESFNEMLDANSTWNYSSNDAFEAINMYNEAFVRTVRATGGNNVRRNLILNTYAASSTPQALSAFRLPDDTVEEHLLAEVHSYAPYLFAFDTDNPKNVFDASCEKEVKGIVEDLNNYLVGKGIPCVIGEYGADTSKREETELAKQAKCYVSAAAKYDIPCFYWMALSDGQDRAVPKWTKPTLKDAILKAYKDSKN